MKITALLSLFASASAFAPATQQSTSTTLNSDTLKDLESFATKSNPALNYYDPLNLVDLDFYGKGQDATIGFLRHAEIKHGRVAMAAFVGYCVQSNWHWPWKQSLDGSEWPSSDLSPEAQWDAIPGNAKWQIFTVIAALEIWDETNGGLESGVHYMKGRQPGKYPSFQSFRDNVHFVLDLYDPFGFSKKMSAESKERRLVMEVNNGRLAMIGIFGFMAADAVPGSVPILDRFNIAIPYDGQIMAPLSSEFSFFGP